MLDFPTPKAMAKALRGALADHGHALSHGQCLDLVARQLGYADWNVLAARQQPEHGPDGLVMPDGWFAAHPSRSEYFRMGIDPANPGIARIEARKGVSIAPDITGVMMQSFSASAYRGKRLSLSAELKTQGAALGTIWMRVDPANGRYLAFDNMLDRGEDGPLQGNSDWAERRVVLDVPEGADSIHFGFFLQGSGAVLARRFALGVAADECPVTGRGRFPDDPINLGFS